MTLGPTGAARVPVPVPRPGAVLTSEYGYYLVRHYGTGYLVPVPVPGTCTLMKPETSFETSLETDSRDKMRRIRR